MSILDPLMRYGNAVAMEQGALQSSRATPEDAKMLSRLATRAQELASEHGIVLTRKEALQRARGNLAFVKAVYGAKEVKS